MDCSSALTNTKYDPPVGVSLLPVAFKLSSGAGEAAPRSLGSCLRSRAFGWPSGSLRGRLLGEDWALRARLDRCEMLGPGLGEAGRCLATAGEAGLGLGLGLPKGSIEEMALETRWRKQLCQPSNPILETLPGADVDKTKSPMI